jgi:hypothetical protein
VRVTANGSTVMPVGAILPAVTFLSPELYKAVHQVFPPVEPGGSNLVQYDPGLESITVHPGGRGTMTVGRLDLLAPANAWRVSAQVSLEHEAASPTEFALLTAAPTASGDAALFTPLDEESARFSGWARLSASESKRISAFFPQGYNGPLAVYLLTRQPPGSNVDFAWARFAQLEFNAPPPAVPAHREPAQCNGAAGTPLPSWSQRPRLDVSHSTAVTADVQA